MTSDVRAVVEPRRSFDSRSVERLGAREAVRTLNPSALQLRALCAGHSRTSLVDALTLALEGRVADGRERTALAALLASWLFDDNGGAETPPIDDALVDQVNRALRARTH